MTKIHFRKIVEIIAIAFMSFFAIGYLMVFFYILVSVIHTAFPTWISGSTESTPNFVRNSLELISFLATFGVALIAIFALKFARLQANEAANARLATIYTTIEARWASADIRKSREYFRVMD